MSRLATSRPKWHWSSAARGVIIALLLIFAAFPIYYLVLNSFESTSELSAPRSPLLPLHATTSNFSAAFRGTGLPQAMLNSVIVASATTAISLIAGVLCAYGLARLKFRGRVVLYNWTFITQLLPSVVFLVPLFILWQTLHLYGTYASLIITYCAFSVPLAVLLLCAYMRNLPAEVEEQGMVDGCNRLRVIWHVVAPMALPGVISAAILVFLQAWGEYIVALVLVGASSTATLPVVLEGFVGKHATAFGPMFAAAVISIVPVWVLFFAMQKRFIGGLTLGSAR